MNKKQFLIKLDSYLQKLPSAERHDILQDFEEHFAFGIEEGKTEEEITESLGSPQQIAKELKATYHIEKVEEKVTTGNVLRAVIAAISLGFFNFVIVLGPFIGLVSVVVAGWIIGISFLVTPIIAIINPIIVPGIFEWFDLFASILLCGLGIFLLLGMYYVTKILTIIFIKYLRWNFYLVKGGLSNV